ncbi:hypothetical protein RA307_26120 [Xanthobacteraceae bacterium Astr-EGSB]|uniref:hypothetical protein n=1 Tax=Astrobacterium formosum TaxID=3069710 RepID=UPI0027AED6A7|nr:hypothetical protein [Xanthobacteraceae bacterium Astr-EGSB]
MLWVLLAILVVGGALAIGSDLFGGAPGQSRMIAAVTWSSALLLFLGRGLLHRTNAQELVRSALAWLVIAAAIAVAWLLHSSLS